MKRRKSFDLKKFLTILPVVIGVGSVLISILLLRPVFNEKPSLNEVAVHPSSSTSPTVSQITPGQLSDRVSDKKSGQPQKLSVSSQADSSVSEDAGMAEWDASVAEMNKSESTEETISESQEERFSGLTREEIEARIPVLADEIRTNLTKAVSLYNELRSTDGMAERSPEIAKWRDETWTEVKRLFQDVSRLKIPLYVSYLKVSGRYDNPLAEGGWIYELMKPLPMRVTMGS